MDMDDSVVTAGGREIFFHNWYGKNTIKQIKNK